MSGSVHAASLIAVMAVFTLILRALPFVIFSGKRKIPAYVSYLGRVLPEAAIAMLVVYCLRGLSFSGPGHGIPEIFCVAAVMLMQYIRHNSLLSILGGTFLYMLILAII